MTEYHDAAGTNPTLASMLPSLTDDALADLAIELVIVMRDAHERHTLPSPDIVIDARTALTSGRLSNTVARMVRVEIERLEN